LLVVVSHHGIHGVHSFVEKRRHRPPQGQEDQRCDNPVGNVLRHGFDDRTQDVPFFEFSRIPTDNHGQPFPGQHQITVAQGSDYNRGFPVEIPGRQSRIGQPDGNRLGNDQVKIGREFHERHCPEEYARQYDKPEGTARKALEVWGSRFVIENALHAADPAPDPAGRMGQPSRITDGEVGQVGQRQMPGEKDHQHSPTSR